MIEHQGVPGAKRLRKVFERYGVVPDRALGQNFVIDPNTVRKVIQVARLTGTEKVLEVGAGGGSLTVALADAAGEVLAVEFDRRMEPVLRDMLHGIDNVRVAIADVLALELADVDADRMVSNLPYNLAATIVLKVLQDAPQIERLTVMTQKEVGERLAAAPGSKAYGQPSVILALHASARVVARVSRNAFYPVPRVDSVIVDIERLARPAAVDRGAFERIVRASFGQRRKTLRNALRDVVGDADAAAKVIADAGIDPGARAEEVGIDGFVALAERVSASS